MSMQHIRDAYPIEVFRLRQDMTPNAEVSGAGTASAGLPGSAAASPEKG